MQLVDLVDLVDVDWSRRWVRFRAIVVIVACLLVPNAVVRVIAWYADTKGKQIVEQILPRSEASGTSPSRR